MIKPARKMYSVRQMRVLVQADLPEDFREYVESAPESTRRILQKWNSNLVFECEEKKEEPVQDVIYHSEQVQTKEDQKPEELIEQSKDEEVSKPESEVEKETLEEAAIDSLVPKENTPKKKSSKSKKKKSQTKKQVPGKEEQKELIQVIESELLPDLIAEEDLPYRHLDFTKDRMEVKEVTLYRLDSDNCPVHGTKLHYMQIRGKGKVTYGFYAYGCDRCKRLYEPNEEIKELIPYFKEYGITYKILETGK